VHPPTFYTEKEYWERLVARQKRVKEARALKAAEKAAKKKEKP
jgi:hypothetical protein